MTESEFKLFAGELTLHAPAEASEIARFQTDQGVTLPEDYVGFLLRSNGAEGPVGRSGYLSL